MDHFLAVPGRGAHVVDRLDFVASDRGNSFYRGCVELLAFQSLFGLRSASRRWRHGAESHPDVGQGAVLARTGDADRDGRDVQGRPRTVLVETRDMVPLINQPVYESMHIRQSDFPNASWINDYGFYIGCHQGLKEPDFQYMSQVLEQFFVSKGLV